MDAYRRGDRFVVHFDVPGIDPGSVELTVEKNVLTVRAERARSGEDGVDWLASERPHGTFGRQLFLGDSLDADRIEASYDNGVLTVPVPLAEKEKARRVEITSGRPEPIDAASSAA